MTKEINWHGNFANVVEQLEEDEFTVGLCNGQCIVVSREEIIEQDNPEFIKE